MPPRFLDFRNLSRARRAWAAAWLATALNVLAPVAAYASALAHIHALAIATAQPAIDHHGAGHHHHDASPDALVEQSASAAPHSVAGKSPVVAHCVYCPDFAAGAPLPLVVAIAAIAEAAVDPPTGRLPAVRTSPPLAFAYARGPPSHAG